MASELKSWQDLAAAAQHRRDVSIAAAGPPAIPPPDELPRNVTGVPASVLTADEVAITEKPPEVLVKQIAGRKWTAHAVTLAFLRRAAVAQALTNCIVELLPETALSRASELDNHLSQTGMTVGPLHGLPISVKEHVGMAGRVVNLAFCSLEGELAADDALLLKILHEAGAVFHARTTEPQLTMHLETDSNLYGPTVNPYNRQLTAGGSSGGEGALIALRGSVLGIGSDIGGSIRAPAANCGIFGFKPRAARLPTNGSYSTLDGYDSVLTVLGPMSTSFEGLELLVKTVIDARPWLREPSVLALPWDSRDSQLGSKLKVAILWDDQVVKPLPPIQRALKEAALKLRKDPNIEVMDWQPYKHDEAWEIVSSLYFPTGGEEDIAEIDKSGEPWLPLSDWILRDNPNVKKMSVSELWQAQARRNRFHQAHWEHWLAQADPDVILSPTGPGPAPPLNQSKYWPYTSHWNLLDYPALVFPFTHADPEKDPADAGYVPRNLQDADVQALYADPSIYAGVPVGLQLIGRPVSETGADGALFAAYKRMAKAFEA